MARITAAEAGGANILAFLDMIAVSEIGTAILAKSDDGYDVLVGSTPANVLRFDSYIDHPDIYNPHCNSDAAGRYQIMHHWWPFYKRQMNLPDFSPRSQDFYALQQLRENGADRMINAGRIADAIAAVAHIWASLPGAGYGQHENDVDKLIAAYQSAGGTVA